jgi:hypothetical protein
MKRSSSAISIAMLIAAVVTASGAALLFTPSCSNSSSTTNSVLERNNHPSRDGHFVQPALTRAAAATMTFDTGFQATFTGAMFASPLYLENGPGGRGIFFAVTTGNDVFALDETTGAVVWTHNIGPSPTASGAGCGNISPIGILSTPVIDAGARTIYVAGAVGSGAKIERHEVHALSVDDGSERAGWPVDVSTLTAPSADGGAPLPFMPSPENQRSALSLVRGILYVAYGGHVGDCGPYHGWVVAINTKKPTEAGAWATGGQGEGIWAAGGMASDGDGVFASTGNNTAGAATHLDSEEIVRITGLGTLERASGSNHFYPTTWYSMDRADADFASNNPMFLPVPGATPSSYVMALSKDGHMYLLDSGNLGGLGGQLVDFVVSLGNSIHTVPTAYTSSQRVHVALSTDAAAQCPAGANVGSGRVVMSVAIPPGAPPRPQVLWCVPIGGAAGPPAPIATTSDGRKDAIVWFMNGNVLNGVDGDTGAPIFSGGTGTCAGVRQWTSPIAVKGRIVVGADGHLCSWSVAHAPAVVVDAASPPG